MSQSGSTRRSITALQRNGWRTSDRFGAQRVPDHIIRVMAAHFDPPEKAEFDRVVRIKG